MSANSKMTEGSVIQLIAEALETSPNKLNAATKAKDVPEWDSMGMLSILSSLDREGIKCDIGNTDSLQSVKGVVEVVRSAGRFAA